MSDVKSYEEMFRAKDFHDEVGELIKQNLDLSERMIIDMIGSLLVHILLRSSYSLEKIQHMMPFIVQKVKEMRESDEKYKFQNMMRDGWDMFEDKVRGKNEL